MSIWVAFPTCNVDRAVPVVETWKARGYRVACYLEPGSTSVGADLQFCGRYPGYWTAVNILAEFILCATCRRDGREPTVLVAAADDLFPDPNADPHDVARECYDHFPDGYWVMQPTGDDLRGTDLICGSPWFGEAWLREAYEGRGPLPAWYGQFYGDEELLNVASEQGVLRQRPDLTQRHEHWTRPGIERLPYQEANSGIYWIGDKATFDRRKADGWPESGRLIP